MCPLADYCMVRFNGLVDNHPTTYYSHSTEYIASGICVHLQIINIAIQLNTLQVGYVSTCSLLNGHSAEYIASGICVHLQFIKWPFS